MLKRSHGALPPNSRCQRASHEKRVSFGAVLLYRRHLSVLPSCLLAAEIALDHTGCASECLCARHRYRQRKGVRMKSYAERLAARTRSSDERSNEFGHAAETRRRRITHAGVLRYLRWRRIRRAICDILGHNLRQGYCYDCRRHR